MRKNNIKIVVQARNIPPIKYIILKVVLSVKKMENSLIYRFNFVTIFTNCRDTGLICYIIILLFPVYTDVYLEKTLCACNEQKLTVNRPLTKLLYVMCWFFMEKTSVRCLK